MTQAKKSATKTICKRSKTRQRKTYNRDHYHRCQMSMPKPFILLGLVIYSADPNYIFKTLPVLPFELFFYYNCFSKTLAVED